MATNTHPSTAFLDAISGAPTLGMPLDSDEAEALALMREHPDSVCPECSHFYWHPRANEGLRKLAARIEADRLEVARLVEFGRHDSPPAESNASPTVELAAVPAWEAAAIDSGRLPSEEA